MSYAYAVKDNLSVEADQMVGMHRKQCMRGIRLTCFRDCAQCYQQHSLHARPLHESLHPHAMAFNALPGPAFWLHCHAIGELSTLYLQVVSVAVMPGNTGLCSLCMEQGYCDAPACGNRSLRVLSAGQAHAHVTCATATLNG